MRVLVATTAGAGHFGPLAAFAGPLRDAGHEVSVAAPECFAGAVVRAGLEHRPFADADPRAQGEVFAGLAGLSNEAANLIVVRDVFGRIDAQAALPGMRAIVDDWRPDLILRETSEFASYAVAEEAGIPHAHVSIGLLAFAEVYLPAMEEPLAELGPNAGVAGLRSAPCLSLLPEVYDEPPSGGVGPVQRFRDPGATAPAQDLPDWWHGSEAPLVYVSFGSVAASFGLFPSLYQGVVDGLADLPVRVLLTLGESGEPDAIRPCPANTHVEQWWPQAAVMHHAAAMIGHGGAGTTLTGLAAGVPMVVLPLFADQPFNARRVESLGAGIALDGGAAAVGRLPEALTRVLGEPSFRDGAGAVRDAVDALPDVAASVPLLEQVAGG